MSLGSFQDWFATAVRWWEPRRLIYNAVLAIVVIAYFMLYLPGSKIHLNLDSFSGLFILAVLANICYCAAYGADVFVQMSNVPEHQRRFRWALFVVGTIFAAILTRWFAIAAFIPYTNS